MKQVLILLIAFTANLYSQNTGKIAGVMRDVKSGDALVGVNVSVKGTRLGAVTGIDGSYYILNVPPGQFAVTASMMGYQRVTQEDVQVNIDKTTTLDFVLREMTIDIGQEVTIIAQRPDIQPEKTSTSEITRGEEALEVPGIRDLTDLLTLSSDVDDGHFRGGREGEELYNLQGMGIMNPLYNLSSFAPIMSAVEEVEVITSGFSAQYGNAQSGVVNISMKEGKSDKWTARAEVRTRLPGLKHFGPSVWDPNANPYLQMLASPERWAGTDTSSTTGGKYYSTIGNGFDTRYGRDSVTLSQIAYTLWREQSKRSLGQRYDNLRDYSVDATAGGPIAVDTRMFLAIHSDDTWAFLPTPDPNEKRQFMGNIVYDMRGGMTLRVSGAYTNEREYLFRSTNTNGFYNWIWDRVLGTSRSITNNLQLGLRFSHTLSSSTYYDIKINTLTTDQTDGAPVIDPTVYSGDYAKSMWIPYSSTPDNFSYGNIDDDFRSEKTRTITFDGSITSQVTSSHMVLAGLQSNWYTIDVNNTTSIKSSAGQRYEIYAAKPYEVGIFMQDKMEFQGMIANIGLRFDLWNQNVSYYADQYAPFRYFTGDTSWVYDMTRALKAETPTIGRLQPRIGISFPVSVSTVFHVNYGSFVQRPPFSQTVYEQTPKSGFQYMILGNPRLQPQTTNSYDIGVAQALGDGFTIDVSGYYKDVKNLVQQAFFFDSNQMEYSTFVNRDYADIRGFRVGLSKRRGLLTGSLNYTYGVATGKNSTPFNASPKFYEQSASGQPAADLPSPKDVLLDFDRTHNVILNVALKLDDNWGPEMFGVYPMENVTISASSFARSGRPFTYDVQGLGELYNQRTPAEYNTNLKLQKEISHFVGSRASFYIEIINLFDQRIYSYNAVFANARSSATGTITENRNIATFETNRAALQYYEDYNHPGFLVDQSFMIYNNSPRSYNVGLIVNF